MNDKELYTKMVTTILEGLQCECKKHEGCSTKCVFYVSASAECLLRHCPCDYEMSDIQNAVSKLIEIESKMYE